MSTSSGFILSGIYVGIVGPGEGEEGGEGMDVCVKEGGEVAGAGAGADGGGEDGEGDGGDGADGGSKKRKSKKQRR